MKPLVVDPLVEWGKHYAEQVGEEWKSFGTDVSKGATPGTITRRFASAVGKTVTPVSEGVQFAKRVPIAGDILKATPGFRQFEEGLEQIQSGAAVAEDIGKIGEQIENAIARPDEFDQDILIDSTVRTLGLASRLNPYFGKQVIFAEEVTGVRVEDVLRDIAVRSARGDWEGVSDVPLEQLEAGLRSKLGPLYDVIMGDSSEEQSDSVNDIKDMLATQKDSIFSPILPWDCTTYNMLTENPEYLDTIVRFTAHESGLPEDYVEQETVKWWTKMKRVCDAGATDAYIQDPPFQLVNPASIVMSNNVPRVTYETVRSLNEAMSGRVGSYMNALMTHTQQPIAVQLLSALSTLPWKSAVVDYPRLTMGSWRNLEAIPPEIRRWIIEHERISGIRPYNVYTEPTGNYIMNVPTTATVNELQANMVGFPAGADIVLVSSGRGAFAAERMAMLDSRVRVIAIDGYVTGQAPKEKILQIVTGRDPLAAIHSITPYNAYIADSNQQTSGQSPSASASDKA